MGTGGCRVPQELSVSASSTILVARHPDAAPTRESPPVAEDVGRASPEEAMRSIQALTAPPHKSRPRDVAPPIIDAPRVSYYSFFPPHVPTQTSGTVRSDALEV